MQFQLKKLAAENTLYVYTLLCFNKMLRSVYVYRSKLDRVLTQPEILLSDQVNLDSIYATV